MIEKILEIIFKESTIGIIGTLFGTAIGATASYQAAKFAFQIELFKFHSSWVRKEIVENSLLALSRVLNAYRDLYLIEDHIRLNELKIDDDVIFKAARMDARYGTSWHSEISLLRQKLIRLKDIPAFPGQSEADSIGDLEREILYFASKQTRYPLAGPFQLRSWKYRWSVWKSIQRVVKWILQK